MTDNVFGVTLNLAQFNSIPSYASEQTTKQTYLSQYFKVKMCSRIDVQTPCASHS